jgi:hypothetical protein
MMINQYIRFYHFLLYIKINNHHYIFIVIDLIIILIRFFYVEIDIIRGIILIVEDDCWEIGLDKNRMGIKGIIGKI